MLVVRHSLPAAAERGMQACRDVSYFVLLCAALLGCPLFAYTPRAWAQEHASRLVVLRAGPDAGVTGVVAERAEEVDRALLRALVEEGGFLEAYFSSTPFEDVQLLSGCAGSDSDCLQRVAQALSEEWVLVRAISMPESNRLELTLWAQNGAGTDTARRAHAAMPRSGPSAAAGELDRMVRVMVRSLYGLRVAGATELVEKRPVQAGAPARESHLSRAVLRGVGWSSVLTGSALLSTGLVFGVMSKRAHDDHQQVDIRSVEDVDRSTRLLERSRQRAAAANKSFIAGSAFAALGAGLLLWDLIRSPATQERGLALAAAPIRGGAALQLSGLIDRSP